MIKLIVLYLCLLEKGKTKNLLYLLEKSKGKVEQNKCQKIWHNLFQRLFGSTFSKGGKGGLPGPECTAT
jgi:hypothetical protein